MRIIKTTKEMRSHVNNARARALVPTMGNLHQGHLSLVDRAHSLADEVIVSIYVNPSQFAAGEDFATYPRSLEQDIANLAERGVQTLFLPTLEELYPRGLNDFTYVCCPSMEQGLCGDSRPEFFKGVATVVVKLLNLTRPASAIFGEKDFQQLKVIQTVAQDLLIPTEIVGHPIVREDSGLALSSRNAYLTAEEAAVAPLIFKTLVQAQQDIESKPELAGRRTYLNSIEEHAKMALTEYGFKIDYFKIVSAHDLDEEPSKSMLIACAATLGSTRLIDNIRINL